MGSPTYETILTSGIYTCIELKSFNIHLKKSVWSTWIGRIVPIYIPTIKSTPSLFPCLPPSRLSSPKEWVVHPPPVYFSTILVPGEDPPLTLHFFHTPDPTQWLRTYVDKSCSGWQVRITYNHGHLYLSEYLLSLSRSLMLISFSGLYRHSLVRLSFICVGVFPLTFTNTVSNLDCSESIMTGTVVLHTTLSHVTTRDVSVVMNTCCIWFVTLRVRCRGYTWSSIVRYWKGPVGILVWDTLRVRRVSQK